MRKDLMLIFVVVLTISRCGSQGPAGSVGANGAQGSQGTQGTQGSQGPTGPAGTNGTGNILYVLDANGDKVGRLIDENNGIYKVYNESAGVFFTIDSANGKLYGGNLYYPNNPTGMCNSQPYLEVQYDTVNIDTWHPWNPNMHTVIFDPNNLQCYTPTAGPPTQVAMGVGQRVRDDGLCEGWSNLTITAVPLTPIICPVFISYPGPLSIKAE